MTAIGIRDPGGHTSTTLEISVGGVADFVRDTPCLIFTDGDEMRDAEVVKRVRESQLTHVRGDYRGWHTRCSGCSWSWDDGAPEKHDAKCILAPFGVAPADEEPTT